LRREKRMPGKASIMDFFRSTGVGTDTFEDHDRERFGKHRKLMHDLEEASLNLTTGKDIKESSSRSDKS
jgi:hypothetical protein